MEKRLLYRSRRLNRLHDKIGQATSRAAAVVRGQRRCLVHRNYSALGVETNLRRIGRQMQDAECRAL
jgi:hypothetical protein